MTTWQWRYEEYLYHGDKKYKDIREGVVSISADAIRFRRKPPLDPIRGRDVSMALREARTVLSRAQTAIQTLEASWAVAENDPDRRDIIDAMKEVVLLLSQYQRTGRSKKVS